MFRVHDQFPRVIVVTSCLNTFLKISLLQSKLEAQIKEQQVAQAEAGKKIDRLTDALTAETGQREAGEQQIAELNRRRGELETELRAKFYNDLVGQNLEMLVESSRDLVSLSQPADSVRVPALPAAAGQALPDIVGSSAQEQLLRGTTCRYAPAEMTTRSDEIPVGELVRVVVDRTNGEKLSVSALENVE